MTLIAFASLMGFSLILIEFSRSLPELLRIIKTHSLDGLSYVGQGVLFGTIPVWLAVAVVEGGPWIIAVEITFVIFHSLLVIVSYRVDNVFGKKVLKVAALSAIITYPIVLVVGLLVSFSIILSIFLIAATAAYSFPALYSGLTSKTTKGLSVISLTVNTFEGIVYTINRRAGFSSSHQRRRNHFQLHNIWFDNYNVERPPVDKNFISQSTEIRVTY